MVRVGFEVGPLSLFQPKVAIEPGPELVALEVVNWSNSISGLVEAEKCNQPVSQGPNAYDF